MEMGKKDVFICLPAATRKTPRTVQFRVIETHDFVLRTICTRSHRRSLHSRRKKHTAHCYNMIREVDSQYTKATPTRLVALVLEFCKFK